MPTDTTYTLDDVIAALDLHRQRATYGAVSALLGKTPRLLMHKRPRSRESSWIVSSTTGRPTGYDDANVHPALTTNHIVLATRDELASWLESRRK